MNEDTGGLHATVRTAVVTLGVSAILAAMVWSGKVVLLGPSSLLNNLDAMQRGIDSLGASVRAESVFMALEVRIAKHSNVGTRAVLAIDTTLIDSQTPQDSLVGLVDAALLNLSTDSAQLEVIDVPALSRGGQLLWKATHAQLSTLRPSFETALRAAKKKRLPRGEAAIKESVQALAADEAVVLADEEWSATHLARGEQYNAMARRFNLERRNVVMQTMAAAVLFPLSLYAALVLVMFIGTGRWRLPGFPRATKS